MVSKRQLIILVLFVMVALGVVINAILSQATVAFAAFQCG